MSEERCPRCFNKLELPTGEVGWTDDPIKTPKGEAGEDYIGFIYFNPKHIEELQEARLQQEEDLGFVDSETTGYVEGTDVPKTTFTPVRVEGKKVYFYKKHLRELRESTEKILEAIGQTKETYFNYDEEGTEYNIGNHRLNWHDVNLTQQFLDIKAVHIEDLRHFLDLSLLFSETWVDAVEKNYLDTSGEEGIISGEDIQGTDGKTWTTLGQQNSYISVDDDTLWTWTDTTDIEENWNLGRTIVIYNFPAGRYYNVTEFTRFKASINIYGDWYNSSYGIWADVGRFIITLQTMEGYSIVFGADLNYKDGGIITPTGGSGVAKYINIGDYEYTTGNFDTDDIEINENLLTLLHNIDPSLIRVRVTSIRLDTYTYSNTDPVLSFDTGGGIYSMSLE